MQNALETFSSARGQGGNVLEGLEWENVCEVIAIHAGTERDEVGVGKTKEDAKDKEVEVEKWQAELLGAERRADKTGAICCKGLRARNVRRRRTAFISLHDEEQD